ncbi:MAG: FAD-dependent oxidoreductase [Simkaniaceae bacterium]|nr:FAD-dependent oxidoreductase [Simkaniaceae bacterium]
MKKIVILGGGFGGVYTALYLQKYLKKTDDIEITLINKENYFVYQPMLAEVVGGSVGMTDTVSAIRRLIPKCRLFVRDIEFIDLKNKEIHLSPEFSHTPTLVPYDELIFALGNVTDFRGNSGLHEHALPFKNLADALIIRNRVMSAIECAANQTEPGIREQLLTFVVGGGGFSGTEVCAEINDFAKTLCKDYPQIKQGDLRVVLIHSKDRLMERELSESLGTYAGTLLAKRGVEIKFKSHLVGATPEEAILESGERIPSKTIISTVPSSPNPLIENLDLPKTKGRIKTDGYLQVEGSDHLWAVGDCAMIPLVQGEGFCPPTAQFAIREAKQLAKNLLARHRGEQLKPFHFKALGMLGALGHRRAVAELFGKFKFSGIFAWLLWRFIYWMKLPGIDRKIKVAISWLIDMLIPAEAVQLKITPSQGIAELHFESGEIIFNEGDSGDYLYIITEGEVEVFNRTGHLAILKKGEFFGEMALLTQKRRSATVKALAPTNVLALRKQDFGTLIANFSELRQSFETTEQARRHGTK